MGKRRIKTVEKAAAEPKAPLVKYCYIHPKNPVVCLGSCRGATTRWKWETCGYGKVMQHGKG